MGKKEGNNLAQDEEDDSLEGNVPVSVILHQLSLTTVVG